MLPERRCSRPPLALPTAMPAAANAATPARMCRNRIVWIMEEASDVGMCGVLDAAGIATPRRAGPAKLRKRLGNCANDMLGYVHDARTTFPPVPPPGPADRRGPRTGTHRTVRDVRPHA